MLTYFLHVGTDRVSQVLQQKLLKCKRSEAKGLTIFAAKMI